MLTVLLRSCRPTWLSPTNLTNPTTSTQNITQNTSHTRQATILKRVSVANLAPRPLVRRPSMHRRRLSNHVCVIMFHVKISHVGL